MIKYCHKKEKAIQITVRLDGDIQEYALSFLHIWNNAREYPNKLYKVEKINASNDIFVTCNPNCEREAIEYLEQFGDIRYTEEINWFVISAEYDRKGWEELFGDDCEVGFCVDID